MSKSVTAADVEALITAAAVPGLSMAAIHSGDPPTLTVAGVRNAASGLPVDTQTIFDAASLSKPVFAYAVLQLVDAGVVSLDTPLAQLWPNYVAGDPRAAAITVRHVLSHSSGLPNWRSADVPLRTYFAPGERFSYSGEGFVWLQHAIEAATGEAIDALLRRLVFEPLQMLRSSYLWEPAFDADYADPHDATRVPDAKKKPTAVNTAASLQTTADDYARFLQAVLSGTRLQPQTARLWLTPQVPLRHRCVQCLAGNLPEADIGLAWGLGWGLEPRSGTFFQWGDNDRGRFKAFAIGSLQQGTACVVFSNGFNGMAIMPELIAETFPGPHPAFAWLNYPRLQRGPAQ
jgi:CubicO group peptidase (beta-lactamase class C family)